MQTCRNNHPHANACACRLQHAGWSVPSGGGTSGGTLTAGGAAVLYAIQAPASGVTSVLQFSLASSSANLTPTATITAPSTVTFEAVATDTAGNIYVGAVVNATGQGEVLVYAAGSSGTATPTRTILGDVSTTTTTFTVPQAMQINAAGTLAILSYNGAGYSVATLPAASNGTVTPTTLLQGATTQMYEVQSVTIDQSGLVYVTNYSTSNTGSILVFAAGATGNAAPTSVITTGIAAPYGIAVGASGAIVTVIDSASGSYAGELAVFPAGSNGAASPTKTILGGSSGIYFGGGVRTDAVGNIYMINEDYTGTIFSFLAFPSTASGNVSPGLVIQSSALNSPDAEIAVH